MSTIEWTDRTWNPVTGCDRVSPGCDHCYAMTLAKRLKAMGNPRYQLDGDPRTSGPGFAVTLHEDKVSEPLRWKKPAMVFVNSMSDLFHADVPEGFIADVWASMAEVPRHTFQVLTKRPNRSLTTMTRAETSGWSSFETMVRERTWVKEWPLPNVWLGTSIESDRYAWRADRLRATPAAVRFLSCEPLLGPLPSLDLTGIGWMIIGAESGHGARPMANEWAVDLVERCQAAGVAVFVKQLSGGMHAVKDIELFPEALRIREYPKAGAV